jgi:hypothetical protein
MEICMLYTPHNIYHEIEQYPLYYNPTYFTIFTWLLTSLQTHNITCTSCLLLQSPFKDFDNSVCNYPGFFEITFIGIHLIIPLVYIESSSFFLLSVISSFLKFKNSDKIENEMDAVEWLWETSQKPTPTTNTNFPVYLQVRVSLKV